MSKRPYKFLHFAKEYPNKFLAKFVRKTLVPIQDELADLFLKIKKERGLLLSFEEARFFYSLVLSQNKIEGEIAEVGVWNGGSAKILKEASRGKKIYLFDTFEFLKDYDPSEDYSADPDEIKQYLGNDVFLHKGYFPNETSHYIQDKNFSLVHLDIDFYQSTLDSLKFFYPRMNQGGR